MQEILVLYYSKNGSIKDMAKNIARGVNSIDGVNVFGKAPNKTGVVSFTMDCAHSHDISTIIDRDGIAVRAGHHCAQPLMDAFDLVSTTRASVGAYSTKNDFDKLAESLNKVKKIFGD